MPFLLVGIAVLLAAGGVALYVQRADKGPGAGPELGATKRAPDPPAAPVTTFQTVSAAEMPSSTVFDDRANENPDKFMSSGAATTRPIGVNVPEDPFLAMDEIPGVDRPLGYAVDDMGTKDTASPFEDDIERPADLAFAPAVSSGGIPPASIAGN
jgi:hypothetical protein